MMKKGNLGILLVLLLINSCINLDDSLNMRQLELSIAIDNVDFNSLKGGDTGDVPECKELSMDYAVFEIDFLDDQGNELSSQTFQTDLFNVNGKVVTQPVKINMDQGIVQFAQLASFLIYHDDGDPAVEDAIIKAAPAVGSKYSSLVSNTLETVFSIKKFTKEEINLDVLCYDPWYIINFGFTWINLNDIIIRSQCWYGTLCVDNIESYAAGAYSSLLNGQVAAQMPAILKVNVLNYIGAADGDYEDDVNWDLLITHSNNSVETYGENVCLEVFWPDNKERSDLFRFDVYVLMATDEGGLEYQFYNSYAFWDAEAPDAGTDGIMNLQFGVCDNRSYNECTYTQGFWKNHTGTNKKTGLHYWGDETKPKPDDLFLNTTLTNDQVFKKKPSESKYYILAHQFLAAMLNVEVGGVSLSVVGCSDVQEAYIDAEELLRRVTPSTVLTQEDKELLVYYAETLDLFNNGVLCSQHCD
ncbi:hypothetical protein [Carboxylicivirga sp. M1479]|uniref:hypothetical protein n=1 Tax=Carboxylicivirga sp. M1479 TaxID=2594476 RepID=UPI001178598C|nr:hypothetical protein [Carboxylicivirga sp. M1479]TRX71572.1 hypothetical protein FNN09_06255 [Carboxylicivirga sp. M1479]